MQNYILEYYSHEDPVFIWGFEEAILGVEEKPFRVMYDELKIITILEREKTTEEAWIFYRENMKFSTKFGFIVAVR